jgi:hypothetical protein
MGYFGTLVYDPQTQQTLAFGGAPGNDLESVWSFDAGIWKNITPTGNLTHQGLSSVSAAFDVADGYIVVFGYTPEAAETWADQSGTWTLLHPNAEPTGLLVAGLTYDDATSSIILVTSAFIPSGTETQTWSFHAGNWTLEQPSNPLPKMTFASMAYDNSTGGQYLVLFDWGPYAGGFGNDTWVYRNGTWQDVTATSGRAPPPSYAVMTYDAAENAVILTDANGVLGSNEAEQTWEFAGGQWSYVNTPGIAPYMGAGYPNLAYDAHDGYVLWAGEYSSFYTHKFTNQTWKLDRTALGPAPVAHLNVTPQNSSLGTPVRIQASVTGGYGALAVGVLVTAPGCELEEQSVGSWNCTATSSGRGLVILNVFDQAGRAGRAVAGFNITSPASSTGWTWYAVFGLVGISAVLAGVLLVRHRRKRTRPTPSLAGPVPPEDNR